MGTMDIKIMTNTIITSTDYIRYNESDDRVLSLL